MGESNRPAEIPSLTGLRWLAATLVCAYHARGTNPNTVGQFPAVIYQTGWCGVTIFFVLSGFLLSMIYFEPFRQGITLARVGPYILKRIARIYPLYYVLLALGLLYQLWKGVKPIHGLDLATHLVMLHGFFGDFAISFVPPAWSLTLEEAFYLLLPVLCPILGYVARHKSTRHFLPRLALALIGVNLVSLLLGKMLSDSWTNRPYGLMNDWVNQSILGQLPTFSLGVFAGILWQSHPSSVLFTSRIWSNLLALAGLSLYGAGTWYYASRLSWMEGFEGQAFFASAAVLFILALCGPSVPAKILGYRPLVYGGRISYAFYLIHVHPAFREAIFWLRMTNPIVVYILYQGIAAALYEGIERPMHRLLRRRWALSG